MTARLHKKPGTSVKIALLGISLRLCACPTEEPPPPSFNEALDREAIPAEEGSLAGTFAMKAVSATIVRIPIPGIDDELGGGVNFRINRRTYDATAGIYRQESKLCGGYNFVVHGVVTGASDEAYLEVPLSTEETVAIDHERGDFLWTDHVQTWGIQLEDQLTDAFPESLEDALGPDFIGKVYDMDHDDKDGITLYVSGSFEGEIYAIQRKSVSGFGLIFGPDYVLGIQETTYESVTLGNNNSVLDQASLGSAEAYPDPTESWFEEVRVDDNITCDEVLLLEDEGVLSRLRPF
ncbi:MAG: hypothetical protein GY822_28995 [Deltaproteobacteria bacterium]|nr:hypothetical protein [Deltaproteobacteria bacterium]